MRSSRWRMAFATAATATLLAASTNEAQVPDSVHLAASDPTTFADTAAPACPSPTVDTVGWKLTTARIAHAQFLLPTGYSRFVRTDEYRDTNESWHRTEPFAWIAIRIGQVGPRDAVILGNGEERPATQAELDSMRQVAELQMAERPVRCETEADSLAHARAGIQVWCGHAPAQLTTCRETISGQSVWLASARDTGYAFGAFTAWATWQYAPHVWLTVHMLADSREEQVKQLRVLRSVRLR